VIAFGISVAEGDSYRSYSEPGIRLAKEPDSEVFVFAAVGPPARVYNLLLDTAAGHEDLEAFAIVHPHAEITDGDFCTKIRRALSDPDVAVVGAIGATGVRSIAWWQGEISSGNVNHAYVKFGGGEIPAFPWKEQAPAPQEVDCVDGFLMVLSPWAVHNLRFDESLALGHGYDLDYCLQARAAGRKVVTADLGLVMHRELELFEDDVVWTEAHIDLAEKWQGRMPGDEPGHEDPTEEEWKRRARRAEAEREAAQAIAYSNGLGADAVIGPLERELARTTETVSWRITEPLRRINHWRRERMSANGASPSDR
jgi:Glycosyltransferase like family